MKMSWWISTLVVLLSYMTADAAYRSFDGLGNNVDQPSLGSAGQNFLRVDVARYANGVSVPSGTSRPNPRDVSNLIGQQFGSMPDSASRSDYVWQWGQFLDHDITLTAGGHSEFLPIMIDNSADPLHPMIPMMRSAYDPKTGTGEGDPRQQFNENTAFIDASMVYGSSLSRARALRSFQGGQMATSSGGGLLPYNDQLLPNANDGVEPPETLFLAGDVRANEQIGLTAMHTLFVREHNRLADSIAAAKPGWSDEQIYQRARKIVGGMIQKITYAEYLPALLGRAAPSLDDADYDASADPTLTNEFATAAFRLGHTQVSSELLRLDLAGNVAAGGSVELNQAFFVPSFFTSAEEVDFLLHGLARQVQQATDVHMINTLRNAMFGPPGSGGLDLLSLNIQRGRDHGLGSFVELQEALNMTPTENFEELTSDPTLQGALESIYGSVDQLDLWIGLLAEDPLVNSTVGSTMSAVIAGQFQKLMIGDRFFYLWDDDLTDSELHLIANTRLSDVIVRNTGLDGLRSNVFFVPEPGAGLMFLLLCVVAARRRMIGHH